MAMIIRLLAGLAIAAVVIILLFGGLWAFGVYWLVALAAFIFLAAAVSLFFGRSTFGDGSARAERNRSRRSAQSRMRKARQGRDD
ncbi:hypothetical protein RMQ97_08225 [Maricaulis sp. D1M11]|uniref:hypothetical protein n=1 Tax=Maricaulis sp. D1M11 TaxID=3076117 RepID=UPI0039B6AB09